MITDTLTSDTIAQLELAEVNAWLDMYRAAPADYARQYQLQVNRIGQVSILLCGVIPFRHFNSVMGLGLFEPATEEIVDEILTVFKSENINAFWIHHIPYCQPPELPQWLQSRNLQINSTWDRIYRGNEPLSPIELPKTDNLKVERVTSATANAWADYISAMYRLPTTPWLVSLVGRRGWHHYALRNGSEIIAVRSMYLDPNGNAWLGIDAPIPGIMAPSYDLDLQICQAIVEDGLSLGAKYFITDIEVPSPTMDTPAYQNFNVLGFKRLYLRSNYG